MAAAALLVMDDVVARNLRCPDQTTSGDLGIPFDVCLVVRFPRVGEPEAMVRDNRGAKYASLRMEAELSNRASARKWVAQAWLGREPAVA